ncbi:hypothetical protein TNCV_3892381 [Trichonephila clavipes]|nr:hypothetical protein TNCV_3892381 [Trichonephila clavipes]
MHWRIVIKDGKMATVGRKSLVFGACVGHLQVCEEIRGMGKPKERENERNSKKTRAGRFGKRSTEDPGVLDRDADQES